MKDLALRLDRIKPSPTLATTQRARERIARGIDIISFTAGEPDFDTPPHIVAAAKQALDNGMTRYTDVAGIPELRSAVARETGRTSGAPCEPDQVMITVGAKHALYNFWQAVINPGDEVVIPAPYWVSYPDQVLLAGGAPVIAQTCAENGWVLTPAALRQAATSKTKAVVINTPGNPTGAVYRADELAAVARTAAELGLWIVGDEVYRDLVYDGTPPVSLRSLVPPAERDSLFIVDGVSKTYAMTGWRIGWGIGPAALIRAMAAIQGQCTSNPTAVAQAAALAALNGPKEFLQEWIARYAQRRDLMTRRLSGMPDVECDKPQGAFYVLPKISKLLDKIGRNATDADFCDYLLDEARIAAVPGSAFGAPGHIRFSYALSSGHIEQGMDRMAEAVARLLKPRGLTQK